MAAKRSNQRRQAKPAVPLRTSVTFPHELHQTLEQIAKQKKVSVAWVVREAAEKYVADQWPLFKSTE